mgnify:CR=1 FL=1
MRPDQLGSRKPGADKVYFVDSNIFLELELDQERANECEAYLNKVRVGTLKAVITCFHVDSILIVMENYGKRPHELRTFISSLYGYKGLKIYYLSLLDRISATKYMERFGLDFDDALAYSVMKKLGMNKIVSYDKHFDSLKDIVRLEPGHV